MNDLGHLPLGGIAGGALTMLTDTEISITAATTLSATNLGRMHLCSGTSAAYTIGLPDVDGNAGKFIGFRMSSALTQLVTLQGNNSQNIDGQNTRIMWANETAILFCDGVAWTKILGKSIPMYAIMKKTNTQSISTATNTVVLMDTIVTDNSGLLANTSNGYITVQRPGVYMCAGFVSLDRSTTIHAQGGVIKNGTTSNDNPNANISVNSPYPAISGSATFSCSASDNIQAWVFQDSGSSQNTRIVATVLPTLSVSEIPSW